MDAAVACLAILFLRTPHNQLSQTPNPVGKWMQGSAVTWKCRWRLLARCAFDAVVSHEKLIEQRRSHIMRNEVIHDMPQSESSSASGGKIVMCLSQDVDVPDPQHGFEKGEPPCNL
jgi:hypothetical protein